MPETVLHQISSQLEAVVQPGTPVVGFSELLEALGVIAGLVVSKLPLTTRLFVQGLLVAHCTVTVKLQLALPAQLEAVQSTVIVVPGVKVLPEGGEHATVRLLLQASVTVAV